MTDEIKKLENIAASSAPKGIKLIRSLAIAIPKKRNPKLTKTEIDKQIEREYGKVMRRRTKKPTEFVDNYINESASESTDSNKVAFNTIRKLLDESHGDMRKYLNENEVKQYKSTADGLLITFKTGITILMECIAGNKKRYTLKQGKATLLKTVVDSPYTITPKIKTGK